MYVLIVRLKLQTKERWYILAYSSSSEPPAQSNKRYLTVTSSSLVLASILRRLNSPPSDGRVSVGLWCWPSCYCGVDALYQWTCWYAHTPMAIIFQRPSRLTVPNYFVRLMNAINTSEMCSWNLTISCWTVNTMSVVMLAVVFYETILTLRQQILI